MKRLSSLTKDKTNEFTAAGADLGASRIMLVLKCLDVMLDPITLLLKGRHKGKRLNGEGFISWGSKDVFIYFSRSRIPVQLPLVTQPFSQLLSFQWASSILQKKRVSYCSFPIFRTLPHAKAPFASPYLSGARDWRERGPRAQGSPSAGELCTGEDTARASDAAARNRLKA